MIKLYIYNQNCTLAGKLCNSKNISYEDVTEYSDNDIDDAIETFLKPVNNSNDLFKHNVARTILDFFDIDLYQCEVCDKEHVIMNVVQVDMFESIYVCEKCIQDDAELLKHKIREIGYGS